MNIKIKELHLNDIKDFKNNHTLYISDFRSTSESFDFDIHSMFKYENIFPWILKGMNVTVNEDSLDISYDNSNILFQCKKTKDPKEEIISRLDKNSINHIEKIYTAIPTPLIDRYCSEQNVQLNYNYKDFLIYNNKIEQKKLLKDLTPNFFIIKDINHLEYTPELKNKFIKRDIGAGGYTVFSNITDSKISKIKDISFNHKWYCEDFAPGIPSSIQLYKNKDTYTIFGFSEQIINNGTEFTGAKLIDLDKLKSKKNLNTFLVKSIKKLDLLIKDYSGFLGIDFLIYKNKYSFLEANVRFTALTIPTLLKNTYFYKKARFHEDYTPNLNDKNVINFTYDNYYNTKDTIIHE